MDIEKGAAVLIVLLAIGLGFEALSWAGGRVDAWTANSRTAPLVVGLTVWGFLLVGALVTFVLVVRWLPSLATP